MEPQVTHNTNKERPWVNIVGMILLLLGVYGFVRTGINIAMFDKYPLSGLYPRLPFSISIGSYAAPMGETYRQSEKDCMYSPLYYSDDGSTPREATPEEKEYDEEQERLCIEDITAARNEAKVNDISNSILLVLLGLGVLGYRRIFK